MGAGPVGIGGRTAAFAFAVWGRVHPEHDGPSHTSESVTPEADPHRRDSRHVGPAGRDSYAWLIGFRHIYERRERRSARLREGSWGRHPRQ